MALPERRTLAARYELEALLATGGMGQVWRARDVLLGRAVAVKVLRSEYTGDPTFLARFRAEAQHTALLAHRNIATLYDYGEILPGDGGSGGDGEHLAYLVMELVDGEPLSAVLAREGRLDAPRTLDLLHQTASGLAAAHAAGVVHRDVKPGNVLVGSDGVVKVTDFGVAWSASDVPLTATGQVVGTAHYLSPEQAEGAKACPASDVYALGMIGYECLAGRRAFDGENAVQIALRQLTEVPEPLPADVPDAVRSLVGRALLKDPADRYPDGAAFRDAIADVLAGRALPPLAVDGGRTRPLAVRASPAPARERSRGRRLLTPLATLAAGAALGIGALQLLGGGNAAIPAAAGTVVATTEAAPPPSTPAPDSPTGVVLDPAQYLGRPVEQVRVALVQLGLRVRLVAVPRSDVPAGEVTAISPSGALNSDDVVTVGYAVASPASGDRVLPDPGAGNSLALTTLVSGTTPAAPAPVPASSAPAPAPAAVAPAPAPAPKPAPPAAAPHRREGGPGKGHDGHGHGHGHG